MAHEKTPGQRMQEWRKTAGLSQHEISLKTEIPTTTLSRYENDVFYPEIRNALRLAEVSEGALPVDMWLVEKPPEAAPIRRRASR